MIEKLKNSVFDALKKLIENDKELIENKTNRLRKNALRS